MVKHTMRVAAVLLIATASLTMLGGCGSQPPRPEIEIAGRVLLDGKPLYPASIQFTSQATGEGAFANLDAQGRYQVLFPEGDVGAEYDVTIGPAVEAALDATALVENPPPAQAVKIPQKYADRGTSGLRTTITTAGANTFDADLVSR